MKPAEDTIGLDLTITEAYLTVAALRDARDTFKRAGIAVPQLDDLIALVWGQVLVHQTAQLNHSEAEEARS